MTPTGIAISIPAPARGATKSSGDSCMHFLFQFPPLREGRPTSCPLTFAANVFQFPPLREGRHDLTFDQVSTVLISIPAPARGATLPIWNKLYNTENFNSRPCARGDPRMIRLSCPLVISIPAPARGATRPAQPSPRRPAHFNSRPCARGDPEEFGQFVTLLIFQFPPLREGRQQI